jgi:vacuole morphology and inheritance protein 14
MAAPSSASNVLSVSPSNVRRDTAPAEMPGEGNTRRRSLDIASTALKPSDSHASIPTMGSTIKPKAIAVQTPSGEPSTPVSFEFPNKGPNEPASGIAIPVSNPGLSVAAHQHQQKIDAIPSSANEEDPFDARETVNQLTLQFLSEHEETRIAALEWLSMLHQKSPKKVSRIMNVVVLSNS